MKLNGLAINFLGDSITEGCGTSGPDKAFAHLLEEACQLSASRNYGIGGTRIARQQTPSADPKIDRDFCLRASEMDENADVVVVFGGTNDFGHGDAPFGTLHDRTPVTFCGACPLAEYVGALRQIAQEYQLPVLDLYAEGVLDPNDPDTLARYVSDGLHPNDAGHVILAEKLRSFLESLEAKTRAALRH